MKQRLLQLSIFFFSFVCSNALLAQPGQWGDLFSYYASQGLVWNSNECLNFTRNSILRFRFESGERTRYTKLNTLSAADIATVALAPSGEFWVSYQSGRIDYITTNTHALTFSLLEEQVTRGLRTPITHLTTIPNEQLLGLSNEYLYLFRQNKLLHESRIWATNNTHPLKLLCITANEQKVFIGTSEGVYAFDLIEERIPLPKKLSNLNGEITALVSYADALIALKKLSIGYELWYYNNNLWQRIASRATECTGKPAFDGQQIFVPEAQGIAQITLTGEESLLYNDLSRPIHEQLRAVAIYPSNQNAYYIASKHRGLILYNASSQTQLSPQSPAFINTSKLLALGNNEVMLTNGETYPAGTTDVPFFFIKKSADEGLNVYFDHPVQVTSLALLNKKTNRVAIATKKNGILIYENGELIKHYSTQNGIPFAQDLVSPVYISALATDSKKGYLYAIAGKKLLKISQDEITSTPLDRDYTDDITTMRLSKKGNLLVGNQATTDLEAFDPEQLFATQGESGHARQFLMGEQMFHGAHPLSMAFDTTDDLWIGTNDGLVRARTPEQMLKGKNIALSAVFIHDPNDGQTALYEKGIVDNLVVDPGNRLWTSFPKDGIRCVDPNRKLLLYEFKEANSPLTSDLIQDLAYDSSNGKLYAATQNGANMLVSSATLAAENFNNVHIYPNPVRPEFGGLLTIDGLMDESYVKILDSGGELVCELQSAGGRATWNLRNGRGNKVASGVYLLLISHEKSQQAYAGKFVVIH